MFTGLVQKVSPVIQVQERNKVLQITLENLIGNAQVGDSIAVDGICLTLEKITPQEMTFALGIDTLQTTKWNHHSFENKKMNIEPSLKMGDFVGGHWLTGHIDGMAFVENLSLTGENQILTISFPEEFYPFIWKKGFIAINGVSLTIHELIHKNKIRVGIVPETLKRTNLKDLKQGSQVTFEVCLIARGLIHHLESNSHLVNTSKK